MNLKYSFLLFLTIPAFFYSCGFLSPPVTSTGEIPAYEVIGRQDSLISDRPGGFWYALPKTRLDLTITMKKTDLIKGPFSAYAGKYLGIDNVINTNTAYWQISEIMIKPVPVPDPDHLYFVALGNLDSSSIPVSMMMNISNMGLLTGNKASEESQMIEKTSIVQPKFSYSSVFKYYSENNLFETVDTVVEKVSMDSVTIEKTVLKTKMVEKPLEQKAKEASDYIHKLKDQRISLLTGYQEIPYDPVTMKFMAGELEQMEKEYIELFTGITVETAYQQTFSITPERKDDCTPIPLTRFSTQDGIISFESPKGEMVFVQVCSQGISASKTGIVDHQQGKSGSISSRGFVYRIPEWSQISVFLGSKVQKEVELPVPQFGTIDRLPGYVTHFVMDPETGAVLQVQYP